MNELLLSSGNQGQMYFPNSGPGTKVLKAGDATIGWFGIVTGAELFQGWEVSTALSLSAGTVLNETNNNWLKFVYQGKYLFIAEKVWRYNLTWNDLYLAGGVYGVKGNGTYPMPSNATSQWKVMIKPEAGYDVPWKMSIRTLQGATADPFAPGDLNALKLATGNEYNDLLYRLINSAGLPNMGVFEQWAITALGAAPALNTLCKESSSANTLQTLTRSTNGTTAVGAKATVISTDTGWRPVLELLDSDANAFNPYRLYSEYTGNAGPLSVTGSFVDVVYSPTLFRVTDTDTPKINIQSVAIVDAAQPPSNLRVANPLNSVSMTFTRT
jgi:hypothetical protein